MTCHWLLILFHCYINDLRHFKLSKHSSHFLHEKMLDMIHYRKFLFTVLQRKLPCSEKPSSNSCHEFNTSNSKLPSHFRNMDICIIFKSLCGSTISTKIYAGWSGVQLSHSISSSFILDTLSASIPLTLFPLSVCYTYLARNTPFQMVLHKQWVTKWRFFLKTALNPFSRVKFLFHKDRLIYGKAILDIGYMKCA